jgi:hypothetical protein
VTVCCPSPPFASRSLLCWLAKLCRPFFFLPRCCLVWRPGGPSELVWPFWNGIPLPSEQSFSFLLSSIQTDIKWIVRQLRLGEPLWQEDNWPCNPPQYVTLQIFRSCTGQIAFSYFESKMPIRSCVFYGFLSSLQDADVARELTFANRGSSEDVCKEVQYHAWYRCCLKTKS